MLDAGLLNPDLGFRHRGETDERSDFDVIGADRMRRGSKGASALDGQLVGSNSVDRGAERDQKMTKVLDVWLARGVPQNRRSARGDGGGDGVLDRKSVV